MSLSCELSTPSRKLGATGGGGGGGDDDPEAAAAAAEAPSCTAIMVTADFSGKETLHSSAPFCSD